MFGPRLTFTAFLLRRHVHQSPPPLLLLLLLPPTQICSLPNFQNPVFTTKMSIPAVFTHFLFPPPPSLLLTAVSVLTFTSSIWTGISEATGKHLPYSKFRDSSPLSLVGKSLTLSGRNGMLFLYSPALIAALSSFAEIHPSEGMRGTLIRSALAAHFLKRVLEVLFVHKFSGGMLFNTAILISLGYFVGTVSTVYAQHLTAGMPEPPFDLKCIGVIIFLIGIGGNFYHHYLLSKLRQKSDKGYKIPKGGFFGLVICPHYLFEILVFVGFTCMSQTLYSLAFTMGTIAYLTGRSIATRKWYVSKFENFPTETKALVPYVF